MKIGKSSKFQVSGSKLKTTLALNLAGSLKLAKGLETLNLGLGTLNFKKEKPRWKAGLSIFWYWKEN